MSKNHIYKRLRDDFPLYAENQLCIKPKVGALQPFKLNRAQMYLHDQVQKQLKEIGRVRLVILKGRQQGASTYIGGFLFHRTVMNPDTLTFIFAHDAEASNSLYTMVSTYYHEAQDKAFLPKLGASNAKELLFPDLRSGYKVGTAGTKGLGRSKTFQQVHWSEVAYSPNCDEHAAGILQTVADEKDTVIFLESTANGQGNFFHRSCMQALGGEGDYRLVFIPWYWQPEYTRPVDKHFMLEQPREGQDYPSEQEYYEAFKEDGLTLEHIAWRRKKINDDFHGDINRFMREYPFTPEEAFESTGEDAYIKPLLIRKARDIQPIQSKAPLIFGVDPSRMGGDQFKVAHRKGRTTTKIDTYPKATLVQNVNRLAQDIDKYKPAIVNIDVGGLGIAIYDMLVERGYKRLLHKVNFGGVSSDPEKYKNMTAEMFALAREYLEDEPVSMKMLSHETVAALQSELTARKYEYYRNSILQFESKKEFKKELGYSPDTADAWLLTFATHTNPHNFSEQYQQTIIADTNWSPFS